MLQFVPQQGPLRVRRVLGAEYAMSDVDRYTRGIVLFGNGFVKHVLVREAVQRII